MTGFDPDHRVALLLELLADLIHREPLAGRASCAAAAITIMLGTPVLVALFVVAFAIVGGKGRNGKCCEEGDNGDDLRLHGMLLSGLERNGADHKKAELKST
jgi:hypothetical protein